MISRRILCLGLFAALQLAAEVRTLTILHTNDLHSRLTPLDNHHGGFAYLASVIRHEREGCVDCILLNAGDLAQGTPVSTIYRGMPIFEVANLLGYDAGTLGNHDFDYGWEQARNFVETAKYPIVTADVVDGQGQLLTKKPYVILKVNGLRVGVIGEMTNTLAGLTTPSLMGEWHTTPLLGSVHKYAAELRDQCDLVVVLGHLVPAEEKALLADEGSPQIIISGHLHSDLPAALTEGGRVLVRMKGYGEELGRLELKVDTEKKSVVGWEWKKISVDSNKVAPAEDVAALVKMWEDKVAAVVDRPLAVSKRRVPTAEVKVMLEDAMKLVSGADFAHMNSGGVRDVVPEGPLQERAAWNIMPFDNRVVSGVFKGRDLPAVVTEGKVVDPDKEYRLAVSDFTAANQGSKENLQSKGLEFPKDSGLLRDALILLMRERKVIE